MDEEKYATLETQIFISEFFTLSNKVNRSDVGGIQFVYKDYQESFTKLAMEGMYHYVENNIYGDRKQELPEVVNVDVINTEQKEYILSDDVTDEKAYYVDVTINYAKDVFYNRKREWNKIVDRAMAKDFSWNTSARRYEDLYRML